MLTANIAFPCNFHFFFNEQNLFQNKSAIEITNNHTQVDFVEYRDKTSNQVSL